MKPEPMKHFCFDEDIQRYILIREIYPDKTFAYCECDEKGIPKNCMEQFRNKFIMDPKLKWKRVRKEDDFKPRDVNKGPAKRKRKVSKKKCRECGELKNIHNYYFDKRICNECFKRIKKNKELLKDKNKKECRYCKKVKLKSEFEECELFKDGYRIYCKECESKFDDSQRSKRKKNLNI